MKFHKNTHKSFEIFNEPACKKAKLGNNIANFMIRRKKYQITKDKINEQPHKNYAAKKLKISNANLDDLSYNEKTIKKQHKKYAIKKTVHKFSFDFPFHENIKNRKKSFHQSLEMKIKHCQTCSQKCSQKNNYTRYI